VVGVDIAVVVVVAVIIVRSCSSLVGLVLIGQVERVVILKTEGSIYSSSHPNL
jgi:hypothetical protein